jgi:hypothetical protein
MAQTELDMVIEDARKVLGDGATIEKPKADFDKINDAMKDALGKFRSTRDDLEARLMALEDGWSRWQNAVRQTAAQYEGETFGLDPKDKSDAKKIKQA